MKKEEITELDLIELWESTNSYFNKIINKSLSMEKDEKENLIRKTEKLLKDYEVQLKDMLYENNIELPENNIINRILVPEIYNGITKKTKDIP